MCTQQQLCTSTHLYTEWTMCMFNVCAWFLVPFCSLSEANSAHPLVVMVTVDSSNCPSVGYLEHVQAVTTMDTTKGYRGNINLSLRSPAGSSSTLLFYRTHDFKREGFDKWPFMTVLNWGESPAGQWQLTVSTKPDTGVRITQLNLVLYGVPVVPASVAAIPSQCHVECASGCSGVGPQYCDSCKHVRVVDTWECVPTCPSGTFQDQTVCRSCPKHCASCTSSSQCAQCQPGSLQLPSGLCQETCPNSTYYNQAGSCLSCHLSCLECHGPQDTDCTSCHSGHTLSGGRCNLQTECIAGEYFDHRVFECRKCHDLCAECSGWEASECTACNPGKVLMQNGHCNADKFIHSCAQGEYFSESGQECASCPAGCSTCEDDITCTNCSQGMFLRSSQVGDSREEVVACVQTCPAGFFGDPQSASCTGCPPECITCDDPFHCLSCSEFSASPINGVCPQPCSADRYYDMVQLTCVSCPSQCTSCQELGSCTGCAGGLLLTLDGQCAQTCPNKTVENLAKGRCESTVCGASCLTCLGPETDQCLSCDSPLVLHENTCLDSCPTGRYSTGHECAPCHTSCTTCGGPSESECDTCPEGHLLDHFHCIHSCPPGSYSSTGLCLSCLEGCVTCSNGTSCDQCVSPLLFHPQNEVCVSKCPVGFFNLSGQCEVCSVPCTSCSSQEYCDSCPENMSLVVSGSASSCVHCCSEPLHLPCCNCSSPANRNGLCVLVTQDSPTSSINDGQVTSTQSLPLPAVVSIGIAACVAIVVLFAGAVYLYKKRYLTVKCKSHVGYMRLSPLQDQLGLTLEDDVLDTDDSETEVYVRNTEPTSTRS